MKRLRLDDIQPEIRQIERRLFLRQSLSAGALALLTGCSLDNPGSPDFIDRVLKAMSRWNDGVQAAIFNPTRLAPVYPESAMTNPFPFNAFYSETQAPTVDGATYKLQLAGMIADKRSWTVGDLRKLPHETQVTRHICVEGWSAIGKWGGVPFHTFLERIGADTTAKYVGFKCADGYYSSIDMPAALHPQTLLALDYGNAELPRKYGYPMKLRVPTKLGFKNPKHITEIFVTNDYPSGYWEDQGYNWFSGS